MTRFNSVTQVNGLLNRKIFPKIINEYKPQLNKPEFISKVGYTDSIEKINDKIHY